jgi:hypothetical protein
MCTVTNMVHIVGIMVHISTHGIIITLPSDLETHSICVSRTPSFMAPSLEPLKNTAVDDTVDGVTPRGTAMRQFQWIYDLTKKG